MLVKVVVLTGAGISAESGLATFRDADGLWQGHSIDDVATPEAFVREPATVHRFYDARRRELRSATPNPAHLALARLEQVLGDDLLVVTQNVDDLHERAGSRRVVHMHGELLSALCEGCQGRFVWDDDLAGAPACPGCGNTMLRPDVVWFGEMPYDMDLIERALLEADLFVAIGTSGAVYPAAGFVRMAALAGAKTLELNLDSSETSHLFDDSRQGPAGTIVPEWVADVQRLPR
ncbi:NAD-dependent deacylase [Nocardioides luteus]|uniref:NAD-dependent protein deacylase n=1 Tax=Nocardioides luteus TaxID=1844 RepID=A0ABQ5SXF5_9ACTN|nr:NAD-dependent deacylase [Nocardioides luteus]GGR46269.1 NAD-dependent protein deacylase [Nocardioides luteus]GLJ68857.1 NAD-dependent protein deacylase [Nocardioides luteus]